MSKRIDIFTDGSCLGNPGPGGWAFMVNTGTEAEAAYTDISGVEMVGGEKDTTNNRMEMSAVLKAFKYLIEHDVEDSLIAVHTDSSLVVNTFIQNWKKKMNKDLWALIETAHAKLFSNGNTFEWNWVKGHAGHPENERVDDLAREEAERIMGNG